MTVNYESFFSDEVLHKNNLTGIDARIYDLFAYLPDGYFPKNLRGSTLYDFFNTLANEFDLIDSEIDDIRDDLFVDYARQTALYNNFGAYFSYVKRALQGLEDYDNTYDLQGYRPAIKYLLEAAVAGGTYLALRRCGHATTGMAPLILEFFDNLRWVASVESGSVTSMSGSVYSFTDSTKNWNPNEWVGEFIQIKNNAFHWNMIANDLEDWVEKSSYADGANSVGMVSVGNTIFAIGGVDGATSYDSVRSIIVDSAGNTYGWVDNESLSEALGGYSAVVVGTGNRIYVMGGKDHTGAISDKIFVSNPIANNGGEITSWTEIDSLPVPLAGAGVFFKNGYLVIAGGETTGGSMVDTVYRTSISATDGTIGSWSSISTLPRALGYIGLTYYTNNRVYIFGGIDDTATYRDEILYNLFAVSTFIAPWTASSISLDTAMGYIKSVPLGNFIYLLGGYDGLSFNGDTFRVTPLSGGDLSGLGTIAEITGVVDGEVGFTSNGKFLYTVRASGGSGNLLSLDSDFLTDNYAFDAVNDVTSSGYYLYMADTVNDSVVKFRVSELNETNIHYSSIYSVANAPKDMAIVGSYVYVLNYTDGIIIKLLASTLAYDSDYDLSLTNPSGICYAEIDDVDYLYVANTGNDSIEVVRVSDMSVVDTHTGFNAPTKIDFDGTYFYIANTGGNSIVKVDVDFDVIDSIDGLSSPNGVVISGDYLLVSDTGNDYIRKYNKDTFNFVYEFGGTGSGIEELDTPMGLGVLGNVLYIADSGNNRVSAWRITDSDLAEVVSNTHDTIVTRQNLNALGASSGSLYYLGKSLVEDTTQVFSDDVEYHGAEVNLWGPFDESYGDDIKSLTVSLIGGLKPAHSYMKYVYNTTYVTNFGQSVLNNGTYDSVYLQLQSGSLTPRFPTAGYTYDGEVTWSNSGSIGSPSGSYYYSDTIDVGSSYGDYDWYVDYCMRVSNDSSGSVSIRLSEYSDYWNLSEWIPVSQDYKIYSENMKQYVQYKVGVFASGSNDFEFRGFSLRGL